MRKYHPKKIEARVEKEWQRKKIYEPRFTKAKNPFYNLMMFPYPSAEGLHVGNMYAFTGADIYGRYKRMQGNDVFEPIGLDGFGIHSENYALKIGVHPVRQAKISEKRFYKQLASIGNSFAWDEKLETYDLEYYRWTQWLFVQLFNTGLAYRKKAEVNWCTGCLTVLADEQVILDTRSLKLDAGNKNPDSSIQHPVSRCERCGNEVIKKELEQWFLKITQYAERLLQNLDTLDWSEKVKIAQRHWIGKSEGATIKFKIQNPKSKIIEEYIEVFTTRPDTLMGVTFIAISPNHSLAKSVHRHPERSEGSSLLHIKAIHPITHEELPIYVADYVMMDYGTGAIMGVPQHDERDREFAEKNNIPIIDKPLLERDEAMVKSGGTKTTKYKLRDWLISRQRYWGPPIPLVFCENCAEKIKIQNAKGKSNEGYYNKGEIENPGWMAVPEKELPVLLPRVKNFRPTGTGMSPLASVKSFYETKCPRCKGPARRETDVSDTFLDSSWYYLGYLLQAKKSLNAKPYTLNPLKKWLPVNMYIGGAEHSVLHLLYSRFIAMALKDLGHIDFEEPFTKFRAHGLLIKEGAKMSKSKGNVINPDEYIARFGADTLRMYLMFLAPFEQGGDFRDEAVLGVHRFLERVWRIGYQKIRHSDLPFGEEEYLDQKILHKTIKKVTEDIEKLHYNTAISALMVLLRALEENSDQKAYKIFLQLLAPFAPYITEELWQEVIIPLEAGRPGRPRVLTGSIHSSEWPVYDERYITEHTFELVIQVNGKTRAVVKAEKEIGQDAAEKIARGNDAAQKWLGEAPVRRIIFIKNRLINFIV